MPAKEDSGLRLSAQPETLAPVTTVLFGNARSFSPLKTALRIISLLGLAGLGSFCRADGTLTLELPPSQAAQEARLTAKAKAVAAKSAATSVVPKQYRTPSGAASRGSLSSRGGGREHVVGRLGQLEHATPIFRKPSSNSRLLITAQAGTYVAIQEAGGAWTGVLMADGSTGWLNAGSVKMLEFQVVSNGAYGSTGSVPPGTDSAMLSSDQRAVLNEAYKYLGVRYVWGGNGYGGIDCSGFVKNVFGACGYRLPRTATEQMALGLPINDVAQLQAGDRLYFGTKKDGVGVTHTGIYIGNGYFIHSSSSRHGVAISRLTEAMFSRIYRGARR